MANKDTLFSDFSSRIHDCFYQLDCHTLFLLNEHISRHSTNLCFLRIPRILILGLYEYLNIKMMLETLLSIISLYILMIKYTVSWGMTFGGHQGSIHSYMGHSRCKISFSPYNGLSPNMHSYDYFCYSLKWTTCTECINIIWWYHTWYIRSR